MKKLWFALLLSSSFLLAQDSNPGAPSQRKSNDSKGQSPYRAALLSLLAITY